MRTCWMMSWRVVPASRNRRLAPLILGRRASTACVPAGLVLGLVLSLSGCGAGGGSESATRPSTERSSTRPAPSMTELPSETATAPTRPPRTSNATPTTRPPTSVAPSTSDRPPTTPKTSPATSAAALAPTSTSTPSAAGTPAAAESEESRALGWTLLIVLVVGLAAGWMIWRSRRRSAWDAEAGGLEQATRTATSTQLPSVLTAETAGQRAPS